MGCRAARAFAFQVGYEFVRLAPARPLRAIRWGAPLLRIAAGLGPPGSSYWNFAPRHAAADRARGKGRGNDEGEEEDGKDVQGHGEKRRRQGKSDGGVVNA